MGCRVKLKDLVNHQGLPAFWWRYKPRKIFLIKAGSIWNISLRKLFHVTPVLPSCDAFVYLYVHAHVWICLQCDSSVFRWTQGTYLLVAKRWCHWLWRTTLTTGESMLMTHELQGCVSLDWHSNPHYFDIISQPFLSEGLLTVLSRYWWISPLDPGAALVKMSAAVNSLRKMKVECGLRAGDEGRRW